VTPGQVLTPEQLQQLFFFTTGNFTGANFTYSAHRQQRRLQSRSRYCRGHTFQLNSNQPPVANNANSSLGPNSSQLVTGLGGSDPDGSIASYTINTLPSPDQAVLFLGDPANGGVPVTPGQVLTPQQLQQLFFFTTGNFTGANFTYSATDNSGASSPAVATVAAILPTDNQPPLANNANSSLEPNSSQLVTGLGGSDPDGSIASYTINTLPPADQAVLFLGDPALGGGGGVAVTPGQVLTPEQLQQLFFFTTGNFTGANFTYSAKDNSGATSPAVATVAAILRPVAPTPTPAPVPTPTPAPVPTPTPAPTPTPNQPPVANNANLSLAPNSSRLVTGLGGSDPDGSIASYTINTLPPADQAVLFLGDPALGGGGVAVTPGQVLTPEQLQQLFFFTTGNFTGANFTYSAKDNDGAISPATATVAAILATDNQPPVANNANLSLGPNSSTLVTGLGGSDPDGSIASYTINTLPPADQAVLFLGDPALGGGGQVVTPGQALTPEQLQQLFFFTTGNFTGANFTYNAKDNSGATSPAAATVVAILRPVAPTPTPTPASPIISNPIAEPDTGCLCQPIIEKPGINFAPPQQPPAVGFVRPISQFSEGQTTKGTDGDDFILDTKGNQKIVGFEGNDLLLGEEGADEIYGNENNDTIFGGIDTDIVYGGKQNDIVFAGKQNDWIAGDLDSDTLFGDRGADTILGDNGGDNSSSAQNNGDLIFGGEGADLINGNEGDDTIHTGKGDDIALGGKENDLIWGELGSDTLFGGIGSDTLLGGIGDQRASDSEGRDLLYGGFGKDFLNGQQGNDTLVAGKDNDRAYGGKGNDIIYGQLGSDTLYGGQGADTLLGDSGGSQSIGDLGEQDLIFADGGNDIIGGGHGNDTVQAGKGNDCVWGGKDNDLIWGELGSDTLVGDSGDDTMYGGARSRAKDVGGRDLLFGGTGADVLFGDEAEDTISGGQDNDLIYGGKANDLIHGDRGDDLIYGGDGSDELCGGEGNDTIYGDRADNRGVSVGVNDQQDCINGGDGDDLLYGNEGQDTINGDAGSDTLTGGKDNDLLNGGAGNDWLFGDLGEDTLIGGIGSDRYVLSADAGIDTVINFEIGVDKFVLSDGLSFQQLQFSATPNGTLLRVAGTDRVLANLVGVNGAIGSSDFLSEILRSEA
jgi:Ca2+-binding RTX toxin-like protein